MPISTRLAAVAVTAVAALALTGCVGGASAATSTGAAGSVRFGSGVVLRAPERKRTSVVAALPCEPAPV